MVDRIEIEPINMGVIPEALLNFLEENKLSGFSVFPIKGDASDRVYYRLEKKSDSLILMDSSKTIECLNSFIEVDEYLLKHNYSIPRIYYKDTEKGYLVLEDLGWKTINEYLLKRPDSRTEIYEKIVELLISFNDLKDVNFPKFDTRFIKDELSFFVNYYPELKGKKMNKELIDDFYASWNEPLKYLYETDPHNKFVHKDFHIANLFYLPERNGLKEIGIIDFQAAKTGSMVYDTVSVLFDCRSPLEPKLSEELLGTYFNSTGMEKTAFVNICDIYKAQRNIKILGNFAYLNKVKNNSAYLKYLDNVKRFTIESLKNPLLKNVKLWISENEMV